MAIEVNMRISLSWEELRALGPERADAVMRGIAACVSADPRTLIHNSNTADAVEVESQMISES